MKISKELRTKIDNMVNEKFNSEVSELVDQRGTLIQLRDKIVNEKQELDIVKAIEDIKSNPYFSNYAIRYSGSVEKFVNNNKRQLFGESNFDNLETQKQINEISDKIESLKLKLNNVKRDLIIKIEYTKGISDIQEMFESFGLKF